MPITKVTHNPGYRRANVHNHGCNLNCPWCSYRLRERDIPDHFISDQEVERVLGDLDVDRVHFVGGEPTTYPGLAGLARFAQQELGLVTKIGHSNGANPLPRHIEEANISIKTLREDIHLGHCGIPSSRVQLNFRRAHGDGVRLDASSVLIPGLVDVDEIVRIAEFVSSVDEAIPYHIIGYIPVPGGPWRRPTLEEVDSARRGALGHLSTVTVSCWSEEEWGRDPAERDPRYLKIRVA